MWLFSDDDATHLYHIGDSLVELYPQLDANSPTWDKCKSLAWNSILYFQHRKQALFVEEGGVRHPTRLTWLEMGLDISIAEGKHRVTATMLNTLGLVHSFLGQKKAAIELYEKALKIVEIHFSTDEDFQATLLTNIGIAWNAMGEHQKAMEYYEKAWPLRITAGDPVGAASTLNNVGLTKVNLGEIHEGIKVYEEALQLARLGGDKYGETNILTNLGKAFNRLSQNSVALTYYNGAMSIAQQQSNLHAQGLIWKHIGFAQSNGRDESETIESYQQALEMLHKSGDRLNEAITLRNLGQLYSMQGQYVEAVKTFERAIEIHKTQYDEKEYIITLQSIGETWYELGNYVLAISYFEQAMSIPRIQKDRIKKADLLNCLCEAKIALGEDAEGIAHALEGLRILTLGDSFEHEAAQRAYIARVYDKTGKLNEAVEYLDSAIVLMKQHGLEITASNNSQRELERILITLRMRNRSSSDYKDDFTNINPFGEALVKLYELDGSDEFIRFLGQAGIPDNYVRQLLEPLEIAALAIQSRNTISLDTVLGLVNTTQAVIIGLKTNIAEWKTHLNNLRDEWTKYGISWEPEVALADVLLVALDGELFALPESNPYAELIAHMDTALHG
jgi:tetratricopeptide (TPR) repeat protein